MMFRSQPLKDTMKNNKKSIFKTLVLTISVLVAHHADAQVSPMISMYYQNQYLSNPAFAGYGKGLNINLAYKQQQTKVEGTPASKNLSADYRTGKVGLGLVINGDRDGLIDIYRYAGTYAYHLNVNDKHHVSFGVSFGLTTEGVNSSHIIGDEGDNEVALYNEQKAYADGDFGLAYRFSNLTVQGVLPNLRQFFYDEVEGNVYAPSKFFTAISYKLKSSVAEFEPKVIYRGVQNYDNILDVGLNAVLKDKFNFMGMYHSSKNATFGLGFTHDKAYQIQIAYTSPFSSSLRKYSDGNIELGVKLNLLNK